MSCPYIYQWVSLIHQMGTSKDIPTDKDNLGITLMITCALSDCKSSSSQYAVMHWLGSWQRIVELHASCEALVCRSGPCRPQSLALATQALCTISQHSLKSKTEGTNAYHSNQFGIKFLVLQTICSFGKGKFETPKSASFCASTLAHSQVCNWFLGFVHRFVH